MKAAGVIGWDLKWAYTRQLPNASIVWHAVSIDEKRRPYREYLVEPKGDKPVLNQTWFAGVHSDVGGTFEDDHRLADISLKWIVEGAMAAGLLLRLQVYRRRCVLTPEHAVATIHRMGKIWALATYRTRAVPRGARIHASVRDRIEHQSGYRRRIPDSVVWEDELWQTLQA